MRNKACTDAGRYAPKAPLCKGSWRRLRGCAAGACDYNRTDAGRERPWLVRIRQKISGKRSLYRTIPQSATLPAPFTQGGLGWVHLVGSGRFRHPAGDNASPTDKDGSVGEESGCRGCRQRADNGFDCRMLRSNIRVLYFIHLSLRSTQLSVGKTIAICFLSCYDF